MLKQTHSENAETLYASCADFQRVFEEDLHGLYQLSLLLTGDHQKAERCFVAGLEDCVKESRVFRDWARTWAKRVIVKSAIRELHPRSSHSNSSAQVPMIVSTQALLNGPGGQCDAHAVSRLADFDRIVFVLCVLERYRERECALLLDCSDAEVREARDQAIKQIANCGLGSSKGYDHDARSVACGGAQSVRRRK